MPAAPDADTETVRSPAAVGNHRVMAYTAAAMYAAAALDGGIEILLPGVPNFSVLPMWVALGFALLLSGIGQRLPRRALMLAGPVGIACVGYALATTAVRASDSSVLFALPVLWLSLFFGRRGAVAGLVMVGIADALALIALGPYGSPERWVDVMVSVTAIALVVRALEERNQRLVSALTLEARIDPLTGLLNRRGFDERAAVELGHLQREPRPFSVITFDVDHFKRVNDEWGHDVGDRVLRHIGSRLRAEARDVDVLARFGGEEFVALLPGADEAAARAFADRARRRLSRDDGGLPAVRLSAGIRTGVPGAKLGLLVAEADAALYEAKRCGRDRVRVFADRPPAAAPAATIEPTGPVGAAQSVVLDP